MHRYLSSFLTDLQLTLLPSGSTSEKQRLHLCKTSIYLEISSSQTAILFSKQMQQFPRGGLERSSSRAKDCGKKGWSRGGGWVESSHAIEEFCELP